MKISQINVDISLVRSVEQKKKSLGKFLFIYFFVGGINIPFTDCSVRSWARILDNHPGNWQAVRAKAQEGMSE